MNLLIYTVLTFVIALLVQAVSNQIFFGYLEIGPVSELSAYVAVQILLHYALALIVMAIAIMISNNLISMTLAIFDVYEYDDASLRNDRERNPFPV